MRRKIIKQGSNTLTVTLPSKWAKKFNLTPSSEIEMTEKGNEILVSPVHEAEQESVTFDISGMSTKAIWRFISSAYRAGYDEIRVNFRSNGSKNVYTAFTYDTLPHRSREKQDELSPIEAVQALVNRFVGVEIIDQMSDHCIIRELGGTSAKDFDNALRRIFHLLEIMSEKVSNATAGSKEELKEILMVDTNLDRFEDFCLRILNKFGYKEYRKTQSMYTLIFLLELVGDEYKKLSLHYLKMEKAGKSFEVFLRHIDEMCSTFYKLHYSFSKDKVENIFRLHAEMPKLYDKLSKGMSKDEVELLHHLKKIGRFMYSLTELRIDLEYI